MGVIGIRRENKGRYERRAPLPPEQLAAAVRSGLDFVVEPSEIRVFPDSLYEQAGARLGPMSGADLIMGVKEIPVALLEAGKAYLYFSHTVKGQPHNMAMLDRLLELGCTLIDYEKITDDQGRRLVFFGYHAGLAGMIDSLALLGLRLAAAGVRTPLAELSQAFHYRDLEEACAAVARAGRELDPTTLPAGMQPLVIGFSGYGNVSRGAQFVFDHLPHAEVTPGELRGLCGPGARPPAPFVKVVFKEEHMARRSDGGPFVLQEYYRQPELFSGCFEDHLPYLTVLVNCIYWDERYPRLATRSALRRLHQQGSLRLQVIGDLSCDIDGAIEATTEATNQERPALIFDPAADKVERTLEGPGVAILAVDNLPCELPADATAHFGRSLADFLPALANLDRTRPFERLEVEGALKRAIIVWNGKLTPDYRALESHLERHRRAMTPPGKHESGGAA